MSIAVKYVNITYVYLRKVTCKNNMDTLLFLNEIAGGHLVEKTNEANVKCGHTVEDLCVTFE